MAGYMWTDTVPSTTDSCNTSSGTINSTEIYSDCIVVSAETIYIPCYNADNLVSRQFRLLVEDVLYVGILPLVAVVGVVTNIINCVVFFHQGLTDRVSLCLFR